MKNAYLVDDKGRTWVMRDCNEEDCIVIEAHQGADTDNDGDIFTDIHIPRNIMESLAAKIGCPHFADNWKIGE